MAKKNSYITVTDQFCGAGGSSQGAHAAGVEVKLAMNHWKLAIETHNTNFPDTLHDCTDISACDPRRYPSTDILITSPECTNHSLAKGVKIVKKQMDLFASGKQDAAAERSRATMWDVVRFAEYHQYNAIIVENVVDARKWVMFESWLNAMFALGYQHKCVYLNSMHAHPTPQSRDRMYVVFWKKGNKAPQLDYMPAAYCPKCGKDVHAVQTWKKHDVQFGKYRQQYVYCCPNDGQIVEPYYYAAFNCIDWSDIGTRIGDRKKALSDNTIKRIEYGLKKYGNQSMVLHSAYSDKARGVIRPLSQPTFTQTSVDSQAMLTPFLVDDKQNTDVSSRVRSIQQSVNTIHTDPRVKMVIPQPFLIKLEHSQRDNNVVGVSEAGTAQTTRQSQMLVSNVRSSTGPLQTQTTAQGMGVVTPFIIEMNRTGECKPSTQPCATLTAGGINHSMLTPPFLTISHGKSKSINTTDALNTVSTGGIHSGMVSSEAWQSFISAYYNGSNCVNHITEAAGTVTTGERLSIVNYQQPQIEDCYYRMLKPHEIKLAMAFGKDYQVLGSGRDQVKQLGNAVTPPAMKWLVQQVVNSLQ